MPTARQVRPVNDVVALLPEAPDGDVLAVYETNPAHRRAKLLRPTAAGIRVARRINEAQRVWADALGAEVGESDLAAMSRILDRLLTLMRDG
jgi:DNA-binding MarR family transcriptional regulator